MPESACTHPFPALSQTFGEAVVCRDCEMALTPGQVLSRCWNEPQLHTALRAMTRVSEVNPTQGIPA